MKMAKASEKDMVAALDMCQALNTLEDGFLPHEIAEGEDEAGRYDEEKHASRVVEHLLRINRRASMFRVCFGMTVLLDPANAIVDQELSHLELHPRLRACKEACEGISNEILQIWLNPPEGRLGAPHGTWAAQLFEAGKELVELQRNNDQLLSTLRFISHNSYDPEAVQLANDEIAKAEGKS